MLFYNLLKYSFKLNNIFNNYLSLSKYFFIIYKTDIRIQKEI